MEYVIIGGDERFGCLAEQLYQHGRQAGTLFREAVPGVPALQPEALTQARAIVVNYPLRPKGEKTSFEEIIRQLPASARIFLCGPEHPKTLCRGRIVDLWADDVLLNENALLTAEGAVCAAMRASRRALRDTRCLVIGWGRIGRALTEILVALGSRVTVASRSLAKRNQAVIRGAEAVATDLIVRALPGHQLVFNTAPEMVLDGQALRGADAGAMVVDLASPPYGVDLRAAWTLGLRAWREPGIPGRYCPQSAARVLLESLLRFEKERERHG